MNRALLGGAWNVQRRLIRYAVVVPAMKLSDLATLTCRPSRSSNTYRPKSTTADSPPVTMNRHACVFSGSWAFAAISAIGGKSTGAYDGYFTSSTLTCCSPCGGVEL